MPKLPAFLFYPGDWMSDEALRSCSPAARGLWIDMLCLMHKSDRRGFLQLNGKPVIASQLARMCGYDSADEVSRLLQELMTSGTASVSDTGVHYSRRMARDEAKRQKCAEAGRKGGGNPTFKSTFGLTLKGVFKGESKPPNKGTPEDENGIEEVSGRGGPGENPEKPPPDPIAALEGWELSGIAGHLQTPEFRREFATWVLNVREMGKPPTAMSLRRQLAHLGTLTLEAAMAAVSYSIRQNYASIQEPRGNSGSGGSGGSEAAGSGGRETLQQKAARIAANLN